MCIADTRTARVAPKQGAARHERAPAPAFAVVAPAKRFDATEQDARCVRLSTPLRHANAAPRMRRARIPPRGRTTFTAFDRRRRPRRERRPRDAARRAFPARAFGRRFGFFRAAQQPIATATRAGNGARAGRRHRARSARSISTLERPRRCDSGAAARSRSRAPSPPTRRTPTTRHAADTCAPLFRFSEREQTRVTKKQMRRQLASGARGRRALAHVRPPRRRAAGSR